MLRVLFVGLALACLGIDGVGASKRSEVMTADAGQKPICVGHHELNVPAGADAKVTATYAGLRVRDEGRADWDTVVSSLRARAQRAESSASPRNERAEALYRAAGADPAAAFAATRLVGFDLASDRAVLAEHVNRSPEYSIEAHRLYDGRHFVFQGKHSQATNYPAVRDGVLGTVARFTPLARNAVPGSNGFCTGNGVFALKDRYDVAGDAQLYVTFPNYPGLTFSLNLYGLVERSKEPSFAERAGRDLAELTRLGGGVRTIHRESREYAGQKGGLLALSMPSEGKGGGHAYKYFWHAEGVPRDPFRPEIEAELMTDTAKGSIDPDTIEALWRQIMGSLRARSSG